MLIYVKENFEIIQIAIEIFFIISVVYYLINLRNLLGIIVNSVVEIKPHTFAFFNELKEHYKREEFIFKENSILIRPYKLFFNCEKEIIFSDQLQKKFKEKLHDEKIRKFFIDNNIITENEYYYDNSFPKLIKIKIEITTRLIELSKNLFSYQLFFKMEFKNNILSRIFNYDENYFNDCLTDLKKYHPFQYSSNNFHTKNDYNIEFYPRYEYEITTYNQVRETTNWTTLKNEKHDYEHMSFDAVILKELENFCISKINWYIFQYLEKIDARIYKKINSK